LADPDMHAPPSRYKVKEKDGRLIVTDAATGEAVSRQPVASTVAHAGITNPSRTGLLLQIAAFLCREERDGEGRLILRRRGLAHAGTHPAVALSDAQARILSMPVIALLLALGLGLAAALVFTSIIPIILGAIIAVRIWIDWYRKMVVKLLKDGQPLRRTVPPE